jgi:hypothetical protein
LATKLSSVASAAVWTELAKMASVKSTSAGQQFPVTLCLLLDSGASVQVPASW